MMYIRRRPGSPTGGEIFVSDQTNQDESRFAERMFPAPVDPGIAQPDRATCTVQSGVDTSELGSLQNER